MRFRSPSLAASLCGLFLASWLPAQAPEKAGPPSTRKSDVKEAIHGVEIPDPYRWLEEQEDPATRAWIAEQNKYSESVLGALPNRGELKGRISELLKIEVVGIPFERGGRYFFAKRLPNQDQFVLYARNGEKGKDEVLVDPHPMSAAHTTSVNFLDVTDDGKLVAYGIRQGGEDEVTVKFLDVATHRELPDSLPRARYSGVAVKPDKSGVYFSKQTKEGPRVFSHLMGSDPSRDSKLFGDGYGPEKIISVDLSETGRFLQIVVSHGAAAKKTEVYVQDLSSGDPLVPIVRDLEARFQPAIAGERMYLQTNWDAPRGRVLAVDLKSPAREKWQEVVPTGQGVIQGMSVAGGKLFVNYLEDVVSRVKVFGVGGKPEREIAFPAIGSVGGMRGRWKSNEAFFTFTSYVIPTTIYRYDVATGAQTVWARLNVPIDSDRFEVSKVHYASKDGTKIPMFLVHKKGLKLDGTNPTLLTGYGGFTISLTPAFAARAALWAESGGVYAVPNLRGGGEFGEAWHKAGMLSKKQNVFDDFIAAAEWLIANRYTSSQKLVISGGSNGGLLVGAALTQRPDLFSAVVCSYPLLDMVRYHRFLVAGYWVPEYGSAEDPEQFKTLYAYSPYHRVRPGVRYPAVLFITGDSDTRVAPLHARKMTARLQASTASDRPILLHYDTKAGHSGGLPVFKQIEDLTDELSFLFAETGARYDPGAAARPPARRAA